MNYSPRPQKRFKVVCAHFNLKADQAYLHGLPTAPVLQKYAKAPEHDYSPSLRADILENARREHAREITKGLEWLKAYANAAPPDIAALLLKAFRGQGIWPPYDQRRNRF